jgi:type IV fimbrial biogenesis protein FimT
MLGHEERGSVLSAFHKSQPYGFTLVELMIAIAIFSITLTFGVSSYRTWVQNTQIRNAAESIQNGIQRTRAEAVKCNANVAFTLGAASSWTITHVSACGTFLAGSTLESRSSGEGSKNVTVVVAPVGATTITISSLGGVVNNADASATLSQVDLDSSVLAPADSRNLRVTIGLGGIVRMCDPNLAAGSSPMAC